MEPIYLASVGAILSMVSNIPQAWKVRTKNSTKDLDAYSFTLHLVAAILVFLIIGIVLLLSMCKELYKIKNINRLIIPFQN